VRRGAGPSSEPSGSVGHESSDLAMDVVVARPSTSSSHRIRWSCLCHRRPICSRLVDE